MVGTFGRDSDKSCYAKITGIITIAWLGGWDKSYYCQGYWNCHCCFDGRLTQKLLLPRIGIITKIWKLLLFLCRAVDTKVTIAKNTGVITIAWLVGVGTKVTIAKITGIVTTPPNHLTEPSNV